MTHISSHIIIFNAVETQIPKTPFKVRDLLSVVAGVLGGYWFF